MSGESAVAAGSGCDLFVSYATSDSREIAENVVVDLERRGLKCWIAPRDIPAGTRSWAAEIVRSIRDSDNFLLLLSEAANASEEIEKELSEAARHRKTVFVIRVSDIEPSDGLGYHLNRVQWRDLFRNREDVLNEIAGRVIALREAKAAVSAARPVGPVAAPVGIQPVALRAPAAAPVTSPPRARKNHFALIAAGVAGIAVTGLGVMLLRPPAPPPPETAAEQSQRLAIEKAAFDKAQVEKLAQDRQKARDQIAAVMTPQVRAGYAVDGIVDRFWQSQEFRALALAPGFGANFSTNMADEAEAIRIAVESCQILYPRAAQSCAPIAVNFRPLVEVGQPLPSTGQTRVSYSGSFDPAMVATVSTKGGVPPGLIAYRDAASPKALALQPFGRAFPAWGKGDQRSAEQDALSECNAYARSLRVFSPCFLYAAGSEVVLSKRATEPLTMQMASAGSPPLAGSAPSMAATPQSAPAAASPMPASAPAASATIMTPFRRSIVDGLLRLMPDAQGLERHAELYDAGRPNKALVYAQPGAAWRRTGQPSGEEAVRLALEGCRVHTGRDCQLFMVNEQQFPTSAFQPIADKALQRIAYSGRFDPEMIPAVPPATRNRPDVTGYLAAAGPKAIALHPTMSVFVSKGARSQNEAEAGTLAECEIEAKKQPEYLPCFLYAVGNDVILPYWATQPRTSPGSVPVATMTPPAASSQPQAGSLRDRVLQELGRVVPQYRFAESQADRFVAERQHRALVYKSPNQAWRWPNAPTPDQAVSAALEGCGLLLGSSCELLFVDENARSTADFAGAKAQADVRLAYAGKYDPSMIPAVYEGFRRQADFVNYGKLDGPKAIAINPFGRLFIRTDGTSQNEAEKRAFAACNENAQAMDQKPPCFLYASGNDVVLPKRLRLPLAQP